MIILEGPDGAGKSTIGEILSGRFNIPLIHSGGPPKFGVAGRIAFYDFVEDNLNDPNENRIFDRFPLISEQVYGPVLRGENFFLNPFGQDMLLKFIQRQPAYVYCRLADTKAMVNNLVTQKEKQHKSKEHIEKIKQRYLAILAGYDEGWRELEGLIPHRQWDYQTDSLEQLIDWCKRYGKIA